MNAELFCKLLFTILWFITGLLGLHVAATADLDGFKPRYVWLVLTGPLLLILTLVIGFHMYVMEKKND